MTANASPTPPLGTALDAAGQERLRALSEERQREQRLQDAAETPRGDEYSVRMVRLEDMNRDIADAVPSLLATIDVLHDEITRLRDENAEQRERLTGTHSVMRHIAAMANRERWSTPEHGHIMDLALPITRAEVVGDRHLADGRTVPAGTRGTVVGVMLLDRERHVAYKIDLDPDEFKDMFMIAGWREVRLFDGGEYASE